MKGYLKIIGMLKEENEEMTCVFMTNDVNATFNQSSEGVAEIISDGYFKEGKVIAQCKPTYGTGTQNCIIDTISSAPNKITLVSTLNGAVQGNVFYHTPFTIFVKIP